MFKAYGFDYNDKMSIKYDTDTQEGLFTVYRNEIDYDTNFEFRLTKSEVSFKLDKSYSIFSIFSSSSNSKPVKSLATTITL